ncbi:MAG: hypothetical protein WA414_17465 [Acidobacteriaceae bacterium]
MNLRLATLAAATVAFSFFAIGCGTPTHVLQSITVAPPTGAGPQAQFTATSHWSTDPLTITPQSVNWNVCTTEGQPSTLVTMSSGGLATCASGAAGTFAIYANHPVEPNTGPECDVVNACGGGCGIITGTAQLTCPGTQVTSTSSH